MARRTGTRPARRSASVGGADRAGPARLASLAGARPERPPSSPELSPPTRRLPCRPGTAPALFYARVVHRWDEDDHAAITRYYRDLAARRSFARVIDEARPYRDLFPLPWPADLDEPHVPR